MRRPALVTLGVLLVAQAGCSKLNYEKTFTLDSPQDHWEAEFPSASGARKVQVTASAPSAINVCVVLIEDKADAEEALRRGTKPGKMVEGQENTKDVDFEAAIPAKKAFLVLASTPKGTKGKVEVKLLVKSK